MRKLKVRAAAIGFGVAWGLAMLFLGWISIFGWGQRIVYNLSSFYIGYQSTFWGGCLGGLWGFVSGTVWGTIIAVVYNLSGKKEEE